MSGFENSMLDFDINYFLHPSDNASKTQSDKLRKQIVLVKKKAVGINVLISKHHAYREKLEEKDVMLLTAKEECKQVCIDYQELLEKYTQIEKELHRIKTQNAELDSKYTLSQNQYEGMKSHANQLQVLIKEHESVIEALKVEKHLEKNNSVDYEKDLAAKEKKIEVILKHLSIAKDIALGKKKLRKRHKVLLQKYDHLKNCSSEDDSSSDSGSDQPDFFDASPNSPLLTSPEDSTGDKVELDVFKPNKMEICIKKDSARLNEDNVSDYSNEVVSEDTGRGSSLAFSDGEKCFSSPDYFSNDSPITKEISQSNEQKTFMDSGTSPMRSHDVHLVRSPRIFDDEAALSDSEMHFCNESDVNSLEYFITDIPLSNEIVTIKEKRKLVDIGTSPIKNLEKVNIATSPLLFEECIELDVRDAPDYGQCESDINTRKTPCILIDDSENGLKGKHTKIDNLASHSELEISGKSIEERKCLERNNSKIFCDENSSDGEIEMILNTMQMTHRLITPIPETPVKIRENESRKVSDMIVQKPDNLILQEQYKTIITNIFDLKKEWMDMKCFIKNHLSNNDKSHVEIFNESNISVNTEIFDDTSQETIIINTNDDHSNGYEESQVTKFNFANVLRNEVLEQDILKQTTAPCVPSLQDVFLIDESADKPIENESLAESVTNVTHATKNDSREVITFEEDLSSEDESDIIKTDGMNHNQQDLSILCSETKMSKKKNLSKLDKFKRKLLPKSKISNSSPIRKLRSKTKVTPVINKVTKMDPTVILNNKSAYENAAKVMAEIKSKEKVLAKKCIVRKVKKNIGGKKDHDGLENKHHTPKQEENNPEKHIRRKSKDQCDVHLESIEDDNSQIGFSPITTRSRSRKLSSSYCGSPTQIDKREQVTSKSEEKRKRLKRGATDSPIVDSKRVLRSSTNRNTFIDLDNVKKNVSTCDITETDSDSSLRPNIKLSATTYEKQNICDSIKNSSNKSSKIEHRKLSNSENEEQNSKVKNISNMHSKIQDRKLSNSENEEQNSKVKNISNMHSKIQDRKLSNSENEEHNSKVKNVLNMHSKIQNRKLSNSENEEHNSKVKNVSISPSTIQGRELSIVVNAIKEPDKSTEHNEFDQMDSQISHPKQSILCRMLEKHGRGDKKFSNKKVPDEITNSISKKLEEGIAMINELPSGKVKAAMNKLVDEVQSWNNKHFMIGFMKYLKDPDRKRELFNKVNSPPAPPMTKSEQVLLYVVKQIETRQPNTVNTILTHIEYSLFQLNRTPEFDIIESVSHFYALLCRYFGLKSRLRLFLLDAMYCVQFKVVPLIKQCLDVWMHILPLAHMGIAKSPLVTCLVYLLHFYKCEDRFNRVQEIRTILSRKYFYEMTDWNETKILEMIKNAIKDVRDIPIEKKMLRTALIILGKRHGAKWCHKNIIKNILMPMIEREDTSMKTKQFCVQLLGALLKPFPADMKVHFEIAVNLLHEMLQQDPPDAMKEAIFTSLIYINHHNPNRVIRSLLSWMPKQISPEFEQLLRDYVRGQTLRAWKKILSKIAM